MMQIFAWISITTGLVIMFFGVLGTIILPDLFQRFHASTKCGVSGAFSLIIGLSLYTADLQFIMKFLVIVFFLIITSPLVAHMLAVSRMEHDNRDQEEEQ